MDPILVLGAMLFAAAAPFVIPAWRSMLDSDDQEDTAGQNGSSGTLL